jgi:hypothetical protein
MTSTTNRHATPPAVVDRLELLEAQRMIHTIELRTALVQELRELLPEAIRQAKPEGQGKNKRPGNASLLRLISRVAMRDVRVDRTPGKNC